ncbi:MAG: ferritin-like domain-containing protein [Rhizobacter sp.]|nr:ferritin-like domain-containing protein [Rhizobacter sp.]
MRCVEYLQSLGHDYGDFDAHDGLWLMTQRTGGDVTARMALVPRTLEARGLDATPPLQAKFAKAGDTRTVEILDIILRDEVGHVAIGNRWYRWLCERQGLDAVSHYHELTRRYEAPEKVPAAVQPSVLPFVQAWSRRRNRPAEPGLSWLTSCCRARRPRAERHYTGAPLRPPRAAAFQAPA